MSYARFKTENELLKSILHSLPSYDVYPKVSAIGGKKINPDIDILQVQGISQNRPRLIGYEIKLMKFNKKSKSLSWISFYNGIGQAFLYLMNGVDRAILVLGFHEGVPDGKLTEFCRWLRENKDLLKVIFGSYISIGIHLYEGGSIFPLEIDTDTGCNFYSPDEKVQLLSNELLQKKFTCNKKTMVRKS